MSDADLSPYEIAVEPATAGLEELSELLIGDLLDASDGAGFRWWTSGASWRVRALVADYTIQSVRGTAQALTLAALAAQEYREQAHADSYAKMTALSAYARSGGQSILQALPKSPTDRRRELRMTAAFEQCMFNLGRTLDRLAVVVLVIGGIKPKSEVIRVDWGDVDMDVTQRAHRLAAEGTTGRTFQDALLAPLAGIDKLGPNQWFAWMRQTRNTLTHRASMTTQNWATTNYAGMPDRFIRGVFAQPAHSEIQALVFQGRIDTWMGSLKSDPAEVLAGLVLSSCRLVRELITSIAGTRQQRVADPGALVFDERCWRKIVPSNAFDFPGYGPEPHVQTDGMRIHLSPADVRRYQSADLFDDRYHSWNTADTPKPRT